MSETFQKIAVTFVLHVKLCECSITFGRLQSVLVYSLVSADAHLAVSKQSGLHLRVFNRFVGDPDDPRDADVVDRWRQARQTINDWRQSPTSRQ